jgi:hypothetical protein
MKSKENKLSANTCEIIFVVALRTTNSKKYRPIFICIICIIDNLAPSLSLLRSSGDFSTTPTGANSVNRITGAGKGGVSGEKAVKSGLFQLWAGRRS